MFHFFSRWTQPNYVQNIYPYKLETARQISQFGFMGVQLFFIISGFVILQTLEKQSRFSSFLIARFKRIFPSLWISLILIFLIVNYLNQPFLAPIAFSSMIPSLTLVEPVFINYLFGTQFQWVTGVLWSLFVEIQFYILAGTIYFSLRKYAFLIKLFSITLLIEIIKFLIRVFQINADVNLSSIFPLNGYLWWFLAGSGFYKLWSHKSTKFAQFTVIMSFLFNLASLNFTGRNFHFNFTLTFLTILFYSLFCLLVVWPKTLKLFRNSGVVLLGGLSYEFYLIHEAIGVSLLSEFSHIKSFEGNLLFSILALVLTASGLIMLSLMIQKVSHSANARITKISNY
jgi:peptidoglycan/LPS O-acetylase OafA/YrhL